MSSSQMGAVVKYLKGVKGWHGILNGTNLKDKFRVSNRSGSRKKKDGGGGGGGGGGEKGGGGLDWDRSYLMPMI